MKKLLLVVLAAALLLAAFAACCAEEEYPMCEFDLDAYGQNGGMLQVTYADGSTEETSAWGFGAERTDEDMTIGDMLSAFDIAALDAVCEGDVFEGWLTFKLEITTDEDGFDTHSHVLVNDVPCTTEELLATPAPDYYAVYAAKWESIPIESYFQYEEEEIVISMASATLYANGGGMLMHSEAGDYESGMNVATTEPGQTLGEVLELDLLLSISREGYEFAGWTIYDVAVMETGEGMPEEEGLPCFEVFDGWYTVLRDYTVIGEGVDTAALHDIVCGNTDLFVVANWK